MKVKWARVRVSILLPNLDVSHMFYIGHYSVSYGHNVVSRREIRWLAFVCVRLCVCVCHSSQLTPVLLGTWNIPTRSEKVTTNTSEAIYKRQVQTLSSYICSTSNTALHACTKTQYTDHWVCKSISKPHPQVFPSYNTPAIRMDMDCLCSF